MNVPRHVAVIPDGNRRFAKRLMKEPSMGHEWGAGKIRKMLDWCKDLGIKVVTVYTLSLENLHKRPKEELDFIMELAKKELADIIKEGGLAHENRIRITAFGRLDLLPKDVQASFKKAEEQTKGYNDYFLNIAMAYGGRQELVEASRDIAFRISQGKLTPEDIDEMVLRQSLQTNGNADPDLVISTPPIQVYC